MKWIALLGLLSATDRPDVVVADFEGHDFGAWKTTGTAFGAAPARGTLPHQMPVSGFQGKGYASSFHGGDGAKGTLTSPLIRIERRYVNFLIGGGAYAGKTCIDLVVDGKVARSTTGPNDRPGGSERLDWKSWDVAEFAGRDAVLRIVDDATGGWGHVCVDQIMQSDRRLQAEPARREIEATNRYLWIPVKTGATMRRLKLSEDGRTVRELDVEFAESEPSFWATIDLSNFRGRRLAIEVDGLTSGSAGLDACKQSDSWPNEQSLYSAGRRPQYHFTSRCGWLNDPNGLVFANGEYHLFYQHNPYGWNWGNMHWGHAVSPDLVHWKELPQALTPVRYGDWAFSGSSVVDSANTGGFKTGEEAPLVAAYTSTGRGECIVYSNDRGRTWTEYAGNPVVKHEGRDPRLLWHAASKQWVMAVYNEPPKKQTIAFHTSPDLKNWTFQSEIEGFFECPDIFEIAAAGEPNVRKWVLYAADGRYMIGEFDGRRFTRESGKHQLWHGNFYAAQTFSNAPDGRRIQIGWGQGITFPGEPFNQQMTVPVELTLKRTGAGPRLFAEPVRELKMLRNGRTAWTNVKAVDAAYPRMRGTSLELIGRLETSPKAKVRLEFSGAPIEWNPSAKKLRVADVVVPVESAGNAIDLQILLDRGSLEVFVDGGRIAVSAAAHPSEDKILLQARTEGGDAVFRTLEIYSLHSVWK